MKLEKALSHLLEGLEYECRESVYAGQPALLTSLADSFAAAVSAGSDGSCLLIRIDLRRNAGFDAFLQEILDALQRDPEIAQALAEEIDPEEKLPFRIMQSMDFVREELEKKIIILAENLDVLKTAPWGDADFAWLREWLSSEYCAPQLFITFSQVPISEITKAPYGSSPLYNIFRNVPVEE